MTIVGNFLAFVYRLKKAMEELIAAGVEAEFRTSYSTCKSGMFMLMLVFFFLPPVQLCI